MIHVFVETKAQLIKLKPVIQEETHYLNVPCLIIDPKTERHEGLGENAFISDFDPERILQYFESWESYQCSAEPQWGNPTSKLIDYLQEMESVAW